MRNDMIWFSRKQRQVLTWWRQNRWQAIICDGAVRSGKTFCMGLSFFLWAQSCFDGRQFALCGKTVGALRRNLLTELVPCLRRIGMIVRENRSANSLTVEFSGHRNQFLLRTQELRFGEPPRPVGDVDILGEKSLQIAAFQHIQQGILHEFDRFVARFVVDVAFQGDERRSLGPDPEGDLFPVGGNTGACDPPADEEEVRLHTPRFQHAVSPGAGQARHAGRQPDGGTLRHPIDPVDDFTYIHDDASASVFPAKVVKVAGTRALFRFSYQM